MVVARKIVPGEVVDTTTTTVFDVADVRRMWLTSTCARMTRSIFRSDKRCCFAAATASDEPEIKGIAGLDQHRGRRRDADRQGSRRICRIDDGRLRANTFGTGRIVLREEPKAIVVPSEAIHWDGSCNVVFVRDKNFFKPGAPKFFHVRKVRLGVKDGDTTEIIAGLLPGEVIASKNSVVLEAQLLKSNLGAGCGCGKD